MDNNVGITTSNPQSTSSNSLSAGNQQNPQNSTGLSSINTQSSGSPIPLSSATSLKTSSLNLPGSKTTAQYNVAAFIPIAILVLVAIFMSVYIYISSKKSSKNL
jgi:hypothetical protein